MNQLRPNIPDHQWQPLNIHEGVAIFQNAPFAWYLAGGYAVEQFLGQPTRDFHGDLDIGFFRDEQLAAQAWLKDWNLYASDPPGTLRRWHPNEYLPVGIHDIWAHQDGVDAWQFQMMVQEIDGDEWYSRRNSAIRGKRSDLIQIYHGVPCIRIEVQLYYKARGQREKDETDFRTALPHLSTEAKSWLHEAIYMQFSDGHDWLEELET
ncbi:amino acid transporter [Chloroflexi bacterium TSY]|nr:amino acid transporter [Chloroflexi bacterium TSY]